jgi:diguanylate cyclase (GGDEF)-like protein
MEQNVTLTHKRNIILFRLLFGYYILNMVISVISLGFSVLFPPLGFIFFAIIGVLIWKQKMRRFTMWFSIFMIFVYFYFLLEGHPYLVNYIFMWVGLIISAIYQNYRVTIFAGCLSILLTVYAFFQFREEIFLGADVIDLSFLVLFGMFITVFLLFFTKFVSQLYVEAKQSKDKLNFILDSSNIVTFSYDMRSQKLSLTSGKKVFSKLPTDYLSKTGVLWSQYIHPDDLVVIEDIKQQFSSGKVLTVEYRLILPTNQIHWVQCRYIPLVVEEGAPVQKVEGILVDITDRKEREEEITYLAYHDQLTGLPNRSKLQTDFTSLLAEKEDRVYLIFIDLDEFKTINDTFGHVLGDQLLQIVAKRLKNCIREKHIISRISGDEFVVVISGVTMLQVTTIAKRIKTTLSTPYLIEDNEIVITTSIGIYRYSDKEDNLNEMIKRADFAMYRVKKQGKNDFCFYEDIEKNVN